MRPPEAKFLLAAYRPNGADALGPELGEALQCARRDPELQRWFAAERSFDAAVADCLRQVTPPPALRDQLRAGTTLQLAERRRSFRRNLGLASFVMMGGFALSLCLSVGAEQWARRMHSLSTPFMNDTFLYALTTTGFGIAFLHAAIPTHWLPFAVIGQARGWSNRQILGAVALAGGGHVLVTTVLGVGLAWFGFELNEHFEHAFHQGVAAILIALGLWVAFRPPHGRECHHCQGHPRKLRPDATDHAALGGLFLTLTLSPCELFLPVYLTAAPYGWSGIIWLSTVLGVATLGGMLTLTWLTLRGVQRLRWSRLHHLDRRLLGGLLCLLGLATGVFTH
jgi:nickel/cobalt transporter (NicO) family protein